MSIYARSDVMSVSVPVAAGGCGQTHSRPVNDGAPAKTFELDCPQCSAVLKDDVQWSKHADDLPKTPDEQAAEDEEAKRGLITRKEDLVSGIAEGLASGLAKLTTCQGCGKMNPSGMKFCGECGNRLGAPEKPREGEKPAAQPKQQPADSDDTDDAENDGGDLNAVNLRTLRKMAKERGLDETGTKAELVERLSAQD